MYVDTTTGCLYSDYDNYKKDKKEMIRKCKDSLLSTGQFDIYKNIRFALNSQYLSQCYGTDTFHKYDIYLGADLDLSNFQQKCCDLIWNAKRARVRRLKQRINSMLRYGQCLFLTLTFTDEILQKTSAKTRREYIQKWLKSLNAIDYVANIDFGDKEKNPLSKEREHYHAIVLSDFIDLKSYNYGIINCEVIKVSSKSNVKLAKYITKLSNHTYKDSTKNCCRLIYKRNVNYNGFDNLNELVGVCDCYKTFADIERKKVEMEV